MAMTNTSTATLIVPQLLKWGNYKSWSIFMEDYLISQELLDGIIVPFIFSADHPLLSESEWRKRNAAALNAIKISCGPESFVHIKYTRLAKDALDMLAEMHKTEPETDESTPKASNPSLWVATTIVPELLERGNYERWSIFMKNYLISQDLWVVAQRWLRSLGVSEREWRKKSTAALHAIQISCGAEKFNLIKKMRLAVEAWDKLKRTNIEEEKSKIEISEHEEEEEEEDEDEEEEEEENEEEETPKINSASMIVPELLASDNYNRWSICMKSYLVSQDLWDAVLYHWAPARVDTKEWIKKDAAALHAIQISCTTKKFDEIEKITSAKSAWNTLKQKDIERHRGGGPRPDFIDSLEQQGFQTMARPQSLKVQNAIDKGDVNAVMDIFNRDPKALCTGYPILHYATIVGKSNIVKALLERTPATQEDPWHMTALTYAAVFGNTEIAKYLVRKDSTLLSMENWDEEIPLVTACRQEHKDLTNFLYSETPFNLLLPENGKQGSEFLLMCFDSKRFDILFDVLHHHQSLIVENWEDLLDKFARKPAAFSSGGGLTFWQRWIYDCFKVNIPSDAAIITINQEVKNFEVSLPGRPWRLASFLLPFLGIKQIHALKLSHGFARSSLRLICQHLTKLNFRKLEDTISLRKALTSAIENDIYDFLIEMIETNADLLATIPLDDEATGENFLMNAIAFRREKIARFLIGLPLGKLFIASISQAGNTVLHIAGKLASDSQLSHISGAALQIQREIQWFKEVESLVSQHKKDAKNNNGETAYQVLAREHKALLKEAEDWMKGLANSYIIVGALIITIMFAAAFTLPGGNDENKGFPIFKNKTAFLVYIISDAISLFAAAASVIIFLGFLTSRYNMEDFHKSIPRKLIAGLSTLFISLAAVMIAFCSALLLILENRWWIIIPSMLLAGIPISLFARLQFPLLREIYVLTYKSPIFNEKRSFESKIKALFFGKNKIE